MQSTLGRTRLVHNAALGFKGRHIPTSLRTRPIDRHLVSRTPINGVRYVTSSASSSSRSNLLRYTMFGASVLASGLLGYHLPSLLNHRVDPSAKATSETQYGSPEDLQHAIKELRDIFGSDAVSTDGDELIGHGFSPNVYHPGFPHAVVVWPGSTEDVVKLVKIAVRYRIPITPYSGATSLEGHFRGSGGICVDMSQMDKILEIHGKLLAIGDQTQNSKTHTEDDSDLVCQPGANWVEINEVLKEKGIPLFFPLDPGSGATIGGMLSTGCSGTNAVRYGTAKGEWFLNATVVLPSGEVIKTRRRARKSSAGMDLTKLFIGAEGTLGVVTEVTIRLAPLLQTTVAVAQFPDVRHASEAVKDIVNSGVGIQCIELLDDDFIHAINAHGSSARKYPEKDSLFFKFQGPSDQALRDSAAIAQRIVEQHDGTGFRLAANDEEATMLWQDRRNGLFSALALMPGARAWITDVCVPVSRLPDLVYATKDDIKQSGITSVIGGHAGDGNFHACLLFRNDAELEIVRGLVHRMNNRAIALDGTCTGEHGVGIGKKDYLYEELGEGTVEFMKAIKRTVDPLGLFNPGKLYPHKRDARTDSAAD